jgi:hypothetical protein
MAVQTVIDALVKKEYPLNLMPTGEQRLGKANRVLCSVTGIGRTVNGKGINHGLMITERASAGL